ncbi:major facilitator family transporter [Myxococcus xanthus DK 1622]|uniref:Major facilitator family transporter n=1 Tax=Myxococcus xanthus (strain DK1622) TaxID=246197 RepID=Q1D2S9_MYXXD|nr:MULTISPECIES: AmpG family muropeptide MFS transporter [Myxococcus]ABF91794.1 major facilitator family transporter [Myxococcus xanthus DK 1622]NOJ56346.1 AmpG family muropeptide MFS transporter [Myxococcus xanthus]QPM77417.1 AmpG family muropeptide MFS transporter [Myxococcus xanthus]QQR42297.1 AmpG family muropeptide MFS transporter [Myxococcus xanthus]QVW66484.1 AmpG family muropeptide MFS transporter [Myxococcus xanthus DZ2]
MSKPSILEVLKSPRIWLLVAVGFASGLPLWLTGVTLSAWMKDEGVNLKTIGVFGLVSMPYTFKVLWAPLMDRYTLPFLGRRRGWMLVTQVLLMGAIAAMGLVNPKDAPVTMAAMAVLVTFLSASQDIVADAWRTDILTVEERGLGNSTYITGYRLGMLTAGALALTLSDIAGWSQTYFIMGLLMAVGVVATLLAPEPQGSKPPRNLTDAVVKPFVEYFTRKGAVAVILFLVLYKLGDAIAAGMVTPFYKELGFSNTEIGALSKGLGMVSTIAGGLLAGVLMVKLGTRRSLFVFGAAQALTNLMFMGLALVGKNDLMLAATITVDNLCGGLAVTAFAAYLMSLCHKSFSATQYALLSALGTVANRLISASSGYLAEWLGWPTFFAGTVLLAVPALVLLAFLPENAATPSDEPPETAPASPSVSTA